jgi:hypothetical protein
MEIVLVALLFGVSFWAGWWAGAFGYVGRPNALRAAHRAALERIRYPSYSTCGKCRRPWATVEPHVTMVTWERGYFPLCEGCWESMTPDQRLPYYRKQYVSDRGRIDWPSTELAVMEGK